MDLNNYNAILQQLASVPGIKERLQKQFGLNQALGIIQHNARLPNQPLSEFNLGPDLTADAALYADREIQALPYQVGAGAAQAWPGDANWSGMPKQDPQREAMILNYLRNQLGFRVPAFQLPQAPPLQ